MGYFSARIELAIFFLKEICNSLLFSFYISGFLSCYFWIFTNESHISARTHDADLLRLQTNPNFWALLDNGVCEFTVGPLFEKKSLQMASLPLVQCLASLRAASWWSDSFEASAISQPLHKASAAKGKLIGWTSWQGINLFRLVASLVSATSLYAIRMWALIGRPKVSY